MKYTEEMYVDSQLFMADMDGSESNFTEKVVKIRKPHKCCVCKKKFKKVKKCLCKKLSYKIWGGVVAIYACRALNNGWKKADKLT